MKIRSKLIISFIALVLVPLLVTGISGLLIYKNIIVIPELQEIIETQNAVEKIFKVAQKNIIRIDRPDLFNQLLEPFYVPYFERIAIVDSSNIVKFDSADEFTDFNMTSLSFSADSKYVLSEKIVNPTFDDIIIGDLILVSPLTTSDIIKRTLIVPYFLGFLFLLSTIAMIAVLSKIISDSIFLPLSKLTYAAGRISYGDLTSTIEHQSNDEMTRVFRQFDHMRKELKRSLDAQVMYEKSRKELIASISHDLKTPLTSIKGYVEALQDGIAKDQATYNKYLNVIHSKTDMLNFLIDDLFAFSQIELDKFRITTEPVNIQDFLNHYFVYKDLSITHKHLALTLVRPFISETLEIDRFRMTQVLDNLLNNAQKYTRSYIKVYTEITADYYVINIQDDGLGIPLEESALIFENFYKCDQSRSSSTKGTGLGLAICKQLITHHKGKISLDPSYATGCLFKIELPRNQTPNMPL